MLPVHPTLHESMTFPPSPPIGRPSADGRCWQYMEGACELGNSDQWAFTNHIISGIIIPCVIRKSRGAASAAFADEESCMRKRHGLYASLMWLTSK